MEQARYDYAGMTAIAPESAFAHLYLIRHGETDWSVSGQHTGRTDIPLTIKGEEEARGLAPYLETIPFTCALTSPLQRARQTCELAGFKNKAEIDADLAEWDYGDYEGLCSTEIRQRRPDWNVYRDGCPGGETPAEVSDRADRLIEGLRRLNGNIALFSHGQFASVLAVRWIGLPIIAAQHFLPATASVSILGVNPSNTDISTVALWNFSPSLV